MTYPPVRFRRGRGRSYGGGGGGPIPTMFIQPIVMVGASNTAGGDDSAGASLAPADEDSRLRWFDPNTNTSRVLDNASGIPRPGASAITDSTTPGINFAKYLADNNGGEDVIYYIVPTAVGGRGIFNGGDVVGSGPWDPDASGPAWALGGGSASTEISGALYLAHTNGTFPNAVIARMSADFPDRAVRPPIFFGHPLNENDTAAVWSEAIDKAQRCMNGIRSAWGAASSPWVLYGGPPEWTYAGVPAREKITSVNYCLSDRMTNVAYVEGQEENQHPTEDIHYNNAGYRLLGTKCGPAAAIATSRVSAPDEWTDWIDGLTNQPARFYGLYRGLSTYGTGNAIRISNGTAEIDVAFLADGNLDLPAIEAHAGTGDAWITTVYDQMGSGSTMVPEGTENAMLVDSGDILSQGKRFAWGDDLNNILMADSSHAATTGSGLMAIGRINDAGNPVHAAGPQNTIGLFAQSGVTAYAPGGSDEFLAATPQPREPSFIEALPGSSGGYNLYANYVDSTGMYGNGTLIGEGASIAFTYGATGTLSWGGRSGVTNRNSNGSHIAIAVWDTAPTGSDLTAMLSFCEDFGAVDSLG